MGFPDVANLHKTNPDLLQVDYLVKVFCYQ